MKSVVITESNKISVYTSSTFYSLITMESTGIRIKQMIIGGHEKNKSSINATLEIIFFMIVPYCFSSFTVSVFTPSSSLRKYIPEGR